MRKRQIDRNVRQWMSQRAAQPLFVSTVTIGEIERGIEDVRIREPAFAGTLAGWLEETIGLYEDRILPIDIAIASGSAARAFQRGFADRGDRAGARADSRHAQCPAFFADRRRRRKSVRRLTQRIVPAAGGGPTSIAGCHRRGACG